MIRDEGKKSVPRFALWGGMRLAVVLLIGTLGAALGQDLEPLALSPDRDDGVDVIVRYRETNGGRLARAGQQRKSHGGLELNAVHGLAMRVTQAELARLSRDPDVESVSPDRAVHASAAAAPGLDYAFETILGGAGAQFGLTGRGIGVALIDSGVFDHSDLNGSKKGNKIIVYEESFVGGDAKDEYGHGTHVAGLLAGNGESSKGTSNTHSFRGLAPDVQIVNLKALGANGAGTDSSVIRAIDRAIQLKAVYNIRVINLSIGRPVYQSYRVDPLCLAVERAWKSGIVVVVSAGNEGRNNSHGNGGLRHDYGARKLALRHHGGRDADRVHGLARRRWLGQLQFEGSYRDRSYRQTGSGGAWKPADRPAGGQHFDLQFNLGQSGALCAVRNFEFRIDAGLLPPERD